VRLLLDTHAFLWFVFDDPRLSPRAAESIESASSVALSVASLWEIAIKVQLGKLELGMGLPAFFAEHVERTELEIVPLELSHLLEYASLPLHHRDPFDRLIVAQARVLATPVASADPNLRTYGIPIIW
jgi:PIN domain nuclease of toxin-antitoxin system